MKKHAELPINVSEYYQNDHPDALEIYAGDEALISAYADMSGDSKNFGRIIRLHRQRCGMEQEDLAEKLFRSHALVRTWETGQKPVVHDYLEDLAMLFSIPEAAKQAFYKKRWQAHDREWNKVLDDAFAGRELGDVFRALRELEHLTQKELATKIKKVRGEPKLRISDLVIANWEKDRSSSYQKYIDELVEIYELECAPNRLRQFLSLCYGVDSIPESYVDAYVEGNRDIWINDALSKYVTRDTHLEEISEFEAEIRQQPCVSNECTIDTLVSLFRVEQHYQAESQVSS